MPSEAGLRTEPGTAMTGSPADCASETVSSEPPRDPGLHDDHHVGQRGEDAVAGREPVGRGRVPGGTSEQSSPARPTASQSPWLHRG